MSSVRVLGACGIMASAIVAVGGACGSTRAIAVSGVVMLAGNVYALIRGKA